MLFRLATLGALGYAAYNYYTKNPEQVDDTFRRLTRGDGSGNVTPRKVAGRREGDREVDLAGGPLSDNAQLIHAGEGPVA